MHVVATPEMLTVSGVACPEDCLKGMCVCVCVPSASFVCLSAYVPQCICPKVLSPCLFIATTRASFFGTLQLVWDGNRTFAF
ncbi:hypothetical protein DUNSADRAFT_4537 [Dunaliella salina]|uniref:Secreted protein n=1 Tax=Dunaliella salina TaxID=3046 RepID=A0ABQ7GRU3_DUNSA|nr:hypothetical protein DUNSADRAFT_4537 [Dunaliella salina]|eukprot:KAF5837329.1 hypothetical protein DUNSADRAFT_4537 [Dunaliella salina]